MQEWEETLDQDDITHRLNAIYEREQSELDPVFRELLARALSDKWPSPESEAQA